MRLGRPLHLRLFAKSAASEALRAACAGRALLRVRPAPGFLWIDLRGDWEAQLKRRLRKRLRNLRRRAEERGR